mmetsp:Transcript_3234/g.7519  ORF Transcript_3234/g.7519 Transcript_3234/m.7519 type:complete len:339 (+) Transcript_3234:936-1952(+)
MADLVSMPEPGESELKAKDLRLRYMSCSWLSSFQLEFSTARLTLEEYEPEALEKMRVAASRRDRPSSSACSSACLRTKFISSGSSCSAASFTARSSRFIWFTNRSRNTPEQFTTTSMRGRPSSSRLMSSSLLTRPRASGMGRTPTISITCARLSPYVLMLSVPHSTSAMDSGYTPFCSTRWRSIRRSTTTLADAMAAEVGMAWGSRAWMFLPVGSTLGLRIGSPPGPGSTYCPSSASVRAPSSLSVTICSRQKRRYPKSLRHAATSTFSNLLPFRASPQGSARFAPPNMAPSPPRALAARRPEGSDALDTNSPTMTRDASVMSCSSCTSSRMPASLAR